MWWKIVLALSHVFVVHLLLASKATDREGKTMSIDRWNRNDCKQAFLNAKSLMNSTAERQDSTREFCMALWYHDHPERADNDMINNIVPYLANCVRICNDEYDFELVANGMTNIYSEGVSQGIAAGEDHWRSVGYTEGYEDGHADGHADGLEEARYE